MNAYEKLKPYFGDIHNHCNISYGHGSIEDAFSNAGEQLDFCSVTGHAFWPDMPESDALNREIIDFHKKGFNRLRKNWEHVKAVSREQNRDGEFITFLSFEMHSSEFGDYTVVYKDLEGDILYSNGLPELVDRLRDLRGSSIEVVAIPHHIGYKRGQRGINWDTFSSEFSPVVEIISMHGLAEADENTRPYLHSMGPCDHRSTMQYGLEKGCVFGVIGSTDHHSAHPGSHGHGRTGIWAEGNSRSAVWEAFLERRTYALTGDRIELKFAINGSPMGADLPRSRDRAVEIKVAAGGAIDCVDVIRNNRLIRRFSEYDVDVTEPGDVIRTKLFLELGWGQRRTRTDWDVSLGISEGRIVGIEPRFKGREVVSPLEKESYYSDMHYNSHWERVDDRTVCLKTVTYGNPNNSTCANQGICLDVEIPSRSEVRAVINGRDIKIPISRLLEGAQGGRLSGIPSPSYRFHRAPLPREFQWNLAFNDTNRADGVPRGNTVKDSYYVRVRQKNDQWAWSSPIFIVR
jgi:hypothetical protein